MKKMSLFVSFPMIKFHLTFRIQITKFFDSIRESDNFGWTDKRTEEKRMLKMQRNGIFHFQRTNPTDKTKELNIYL